MSQNIDSIANVVEMTLSAKILTSQFREIAKRTGFKTILLLEEIFAKWPSVVQCSVYTLKYYCLVHISENDRQKKRISYLGRTVCEELIFKLSFQSFYK